MKRTFQPSNLVRKRRHGYRSRMSTVGGRNVIRSRRSKGRKKLSAQLTFFKKNIYFIQLNNQQAGKMKLQTLKHRKDFVLSNKFAKKIFSKNFIIQKYTNSDSID